ncbi:MAG: hypothetical protein ABIO35_08060 [Nitrobacter sp.]
MALEIEASLRSPAVPFEIRRLICEMSFANPLWGAPRIHGELLKLGIEIGQTSVARYMARRRAPPSQGWKTFLRNHADGIAAMDLFVVSAILFRLRYGLLIRGHGRRQILWFRVTAHPTDEWIANSWRALWLSSIVAILVAVLILHADFNAIPSAVVIEVVVARAILAFVIPIAVALVSVGVCSPVAVFRTVVAASTALIFTIHSPISANATLLTIVMITCMFSAVRVHFFPVIFSAGALVILIGTLSWLTRGVLT